MAKRSEQETIISRAGDDDHWLVWSDDRRMLGQLRRLAVRLALQVESGGTDRPWVQISVPACRVQILHVCKAYSKLEGEKREALVRRLREGREVAARMSRGRNAAGQGIEADSDRKETREAR